MKAIQTIIINDRRIFTIDHNVVHPEFDLGMYEVESIQQESVLITGDPYDHYVGRDKRHNEVFRINCLVPCEVIYLPT